MAKLNKITHPRTFDAFFASFDQDETVDNLYCLCSEMEEELNEQHAAIEPREKPKHNKTWFCIFCFIACVFFYGIPWCIVQLVRFIG